MSDDFPTYAGIGSRKTPTFFLGYMQGLAQRLRVDHGAWLRSGGAKGADQAFEKGAGVRKSIFLPEDATPEAEAIAARFHPAWDNCNEFARNAHARNTLIMLGRDLNEPVDFVVCWTEAGLLSGGTGQALRIAAEYGIPVYNLGQDGSSGALEVMLTNRRWRMRG